MRKEKMEKKDEEAVRVQALDEMQHDEQRDLGKGIWKWKMKRRVWKEEGVEEREDGV